MQRLSIITANRPFGRIATSAAALSAAFLATVTGLRDGRLRIFTGRITIAAIVVGWGGAIRTGLDCLGAPIIGACEAQHTPIPHSYAAIQAFLLHGALNDRAASVGMPQLSRTRADFHDNTQDQRRLCCTI